MTTEKRIYATIGKMKLGASYRDGDELVMVWDTQSTVNACALYKIERFRDHKLTEATLRELFTDKK